jgi:osmotically inducible protein OsmC
MPAVKQNEAQVTWTGDLMKGSGQLKVASGAFPEQKVTFSARTEGAEHMTNPEELIAAAHAICYSMAFSNHLAKNGTPPEQLHVRAVCSLERTDDGLKISKMDLFVDGKVPGVEGLEFNRLAAEAEKVCPVSNALRGNVDIALKPVVATGVK